MSRVGAAAVAAGAVLVGCMPWQGEEAQEKKDAGVAAAAKASAAAAGQANLRKTRLAAAAKVRANELGQIPVLMYHRVVDKPTTQDDRTPAQFRAELERLAQEGYVPITAAEYVTGRIDIPAGRHPVVLTFDDSSPSQFDLDGVGAPKPLTAVAILQEVAQRHPGFRPVATFYVTRDMFGKATPEEQAQMLMWLHDKGYDIGNHTRDHKSLRGKPEKQVNAEVAAGHQLITKLISTNPVTLALPYGNQPDHKQWGLKGATDGVSYDYGGVFLAGYTPAMSPFSKNFDPLGIPRIRSMDKTGDCAKFCSTAWLDWLKANSDERYTSDGDVKSVAFPKFKSPFVVKRFSERVLAY
ncbi:MULTISPECIES: polysaccharide deacetylase family protein [Streptosporangium]|uniref:Peptidoglycan/xylan/chitin deacetylase (PgdA/CDA1 family) n=1 Tax=Streptosporangium brasiliense TaxID=47480 RepID=A0ABT9R4J5_9ACTN|nr:polysaccharide deacetylase family protein [Streptosporangium brasiliense]MDP9864149.1 peptidoglycan/xylan/chitin deacetylase (PgdA/CDA1 family) [Streptosporangium brasiliense]